MIYAYYIRDNDYFYYGSPYPDAREATQEEIAAHYAEIEVNRHGFNRHLRVI